MRFKAYIDLFVFDLDGTALGGQEPYRRLPDRFSAFLDAIHDEGVRWCTNTTWHPALQDEMIRDSAVRSRPAALFGRTGMLRAVYESGQTVAVPDEVLLREAQRLEDAFPKAVLPRLQAACRETLSDLPPCMETYDDEKLFVNFRPAPKHFARVEDAVRDALDGCVGVHVDAREADGLISVTPALMTKGSALARMQRELRATPDRTLVAGDSGNDLTMLDIALAAYQVCPSNATTVVRERVQANNGCVGHLPYADGVIQTIKRLFSIP